jgi:hypothetical protein
MAAPLNFTVIHNVLGLDVGAVLVLHHDLFSPLVLGRVSIGHVVRLPLPCLRSRLVNILTVPRNLGLLKAWLAVIVVTTLTSTIFSTTNSFLSAGEVRIIVRADLPRIQNHRLFIMAVYHVITLVVAYLL